VGISEGAGLTHVTRVVALCGVGYTRNYRAERCMREAKITQIFESANQIQRLVIARSLNR